MFFRSAFLVAFIVAAIGPVMSAPSPSRDHVVNWASIREGKAHTKAPPHHGHHHSADKLLTEHKGSTHDVPAPAPIALQTRKFSISDLFDAASFADQLFSSGSSSGGNNNKRELAQDLLERKLPGIGVGDLFSLASLVDQVATTNLKLKRDVVPLETDPEALRSDPSFGQDLEEQKKRELAHVQNLLERHFSFGDIFSLFSLADQVVTSDLHLKRDIVPLEADPEARHFDLSEDSDEQKKRELAHTQDLLERKFSFGDIFSLFSFADQIATNNLHLKRDIVSSETDPDADADPSDLLTPTPTELEARRETLLSFCGNPAATGSELVDSLCQEVGSLESQAESHLKRSKGLSTFFDFAKNFGNTGYSVSTVIGDMNKISPQPSSA